MIKNANGRMPDTPHRRGMHLLVEPEALIVHAAIKMNGQLRNAHDRFGANQHGARIAEYQTTCQTKLAIQPRVEQWSTVDLNAQLLPAIPTCVGSWLECEAGRIGV